MLPMASTAARPPGRAINAKIVDLAGIVTKKMLVIQNIKMTFTWKHPKHYKRIPREKAQVNAHSVSIKAISPEESTDSEGRTPKASSSKKELNEKRVETEQGSREDT